MSKSVTKPSEPRGKNSKTPKEIMNKHLKDKDHVISDEDFKNLDISVEVSNGSSHEPLQIKGGKARPKDEDKDPDIVTPWDVIK